MNTNINNHTLGNYLQNAPLVKTPWLVQKKYSVEWQISILFSKFCQIGEIHFLMVETHL